MHDVDPATYMRLLIKFGQRDHLVRLALTGELYMRTVGHFRKIEEPQRGDPEEGTIDSFPPGKVVVEWHREGHEPIQLHHGLKSFKAVQNSDLANHVYCMHAITDTAVIEREQKPIVHPDNLQFGPYALLINPNEFVRRLDATAVREQFPVERRLVEYVDFGTWMGEVGPFRKNVSYAHQSEFRVLAPPTGSDYWTVEIGDLSSVCLVMRSSDVEEWFREHWAKSGTTTVGP